ncbi:MAG: MFS transporter [Actinobacteria bacterium]|nr:MFS transporter [Actinomycetota bacterium]
MGRPYWRLWSAHTISNLGDGISSIAYPWLASAVTRSPILIALIAVLSRLPWLIFTLVAGALTDRFDRKKIIVAMDLFRGVLTLAVARAVWHQQNSLPDLNQVATSTQLQTNVGLYVIIALTALLFGFAEVLRDNSAQTLLPSVVDDDNLQKANGRLWSSEYLMNSLIGPPLGSFIIGVAVFLPFFFDAATFFFSAGLIATLTLKVSAKPSEKTTTSMRDEIKEGFNWLWSHKLFRPMAITLGALNFVNGISTSTFILFSQEILKTSVFVFAILGTAGAIGGTIGGILGPKLVEKVGSGRALLLTFIVGPIANLLIGFTSTWQVVWLLTAFWIFFSVVWNVVTVSLRQSVVPANLLGRVNSVYRFFGWGSIPIGSFVGGLIVSLSSHFLGRESSLRIPYFVAAILSTFIFIFAAPRLTTAKIEETRLEAAKKA